MKTKTIHLLMLVLIMLPALMLSSCKRGHEGPVAGGAEVQPAKPDPVKVLETKVAEERERREVAEVKVIEETQRRQKLQLLTTCLGLLVVVVFVIGTSIGSRGSRNAIPA